MLKFGKVRYLSRSGYDMYDDNPTIHGLDHSTYRRYILREVGIVWNNRRKVCWAGMGYD